VCVCVCVCVCVYLSYVLCLYQRLTRPPQVRMPLWVKPAAPLTLERMFALMKNNFKGNFFEFDNYDVDVGAGTFGAPFRPRGLTWEYNNQQYVNERPVATQQTFTNMVVQIRPGFPTPALGTVMWFGVDGSMHTVVF
jgi:dipeptidase